MSSPQICVHTQGSIEDGGAVYPDEPKKPIMSKAYIFDGLSIPVFALDTGGNVSAWNKSAEECTGLSVEEVRSRPLSSLIDPVCIRTWQETLQEGLAGKRESLCHATFIKQNGATCTFRIKLTVNRSANGEVNGFVCFLEDVSVGLPPPATSLDDTNSEARELSLLIQNANLPIFGVDMDFKINLWNVKIADISGKTAVEVIGESLDQWTMPVLQRSFLCVLKDALNGKETNNYELEIKIAQGLNRYLLANITTRRDDDGQIVGAVVAAQDVTEAAQHDRAVAGMARELRQLMDTANAPIFGVDDTGRVNEWNDKTAEITGYGVDEAFNKPFVKTFVAVEHRGSVQSVFDSALKGRGTTNFELEICTKANEVRYLLVNAATRRDAENNIVGVVGIAQDVTEASKHDRAVGAMASELRQLIDTANAPIFGIDCDGDVNEWNDKTAEITGYTKEEAFDCSLVETFIVPNMQTSVQNVLNSSMQGRGTSNFELEFRTKSSEIRHLLVNVTTRRDAENNVVGVVGVAQDVTEAVQRDRAVAGMALELRQLIDTANAPIFGIDIDGNVNEWNERAQEITGYSKEETFDKPLVESFIAASMQQRVHEILDAAIQGNETSNYECEFVSKSGEPRFMLVNATRRRDPEMNVVGVVGVAQDVTEDRKHAAELRKMQYQQASQEAKVETERNMTAYFAHELRNPLGAIDSALKSMPDGLPDTAKDLVAGMQLCSSFMSSIMNNLLDVRKMEEGKMTLNAVPISLQKLITGVHAMLLPSVKPGVAFSTDCRTDGRDWVYGDEHRIQQVITNVVTNAIKYTVTGSITILIGWEGVNVKLECIDTGPGIPENEQEKLFQRFVQRGGAPGTGLGLAIAKHLVDLAGGSIRFDSDLSVRPGTACIVLMPLSVCETNDFPEKEEKVEELHPLVSTLSFLIVDDMKMNRMMLKRRIQKGIAPNCVIREASTGEEALEICGKEQFDIIVVDQYMEEAGGVMVGTDVVYAMRRMRIESIIIGCSGNDLDEEFRDAGANWVWQKPMPSNKTIITRLRDEMLKR